MNNYERGNFSSHSKRSFQEKIRHSAQNLVFLEEVIEIPGLKSVLKVLYKNRERRKMEFEEILYNLFSIKKNQSDKKLVYSAQEVDGRKVY